MGHRCNPVIRPEPGLDEVRAGRLPWARKLFFLVFISGFRLVVWDKCCFKASGIGATLSLSFQSIALIVYALLYKSSEAIKESLLPRKFSRSPIKTDLDVFITGSFIAQIIITSIYIIIVASKREQIAQVLNHLNSLWLSLGCPRQKLSSLFLITGLCGPALFIVNVYQHILELETPLSIVRGLKGAALCLVEYTLIFAPMLVFTVMIFVYGSLINILQHLDSQIAFHNVSGLKLTMRGVVQSIFSLLSTFSKVVSPLSLFSLSAIMLAVLYNMFRLVMPPESPDSKLSVAVAIVMCFLAIAVSMSLSDNLHNQLKKLRCILNSEMFRNTKNCQISGLSRQLKIAPHPARAMGLFTLDLSIIVTLTAFMLTYFMVFVQLKAIVVGSCVSPSTNASGDSPCETRRG